jgi:uncharacterized cupin superfamily protein
MAKSITPNLTRTHSTDWHAERNTISEYRHKTLDGEHIGARIEELGTGGTSSHHHYHTSEEEHVFMLSGEATLFWGDKQVPVSVGDHLWFRAGEEIAHHLENQAGEPCSYLVYGERKQDDVVVYPGAQVMLIKALGRKQFTYRPRNAQDSD